MKMKTAIHLFLLGLLMASCSALKTNKNQPTDMEQKPGMKQEMAVSLTFQEYNSEDAMNFYVALFADSRIIDVQRWGPDGPGKEGTIMLARFELNGMKFLCSDSPPVHNWTFTPAVAVYVECESEAEIERIFSKLSEKGQVAMPLDNYGFSRKFGWVVDQFGVSWQLNLQ
jgi:predicted 3-demethylubiquinone-9 3-methyltransferase (glyoxalase superfamily)